MTLWSRLKPLKPFVEPVLDRAAVAGGRRRVAEDVSAALSSGSAIKLNIGSGGRPILGKLNCGVK